MQPDKQTEKKRYDERALDLLSKKNAPRITLGSATMPLFLRSPYLHYEKLISKHISPKNSVLELGAGSGLHTLCLVQTGAKVVASDISPNSLKVLQKKIEDTDHNISIEVADIESLPFNDHSFDIITSAGSLSYGDNKKVLLEIYRVLKKDGKFICVDSLNHNPVYKLNRWFHFIRKNRTLSTLKQMPTISLIELYGQKFGSVQAYYFGTITWLAPLLGKLFSEEKVASILNGFDEKISTKKTAFKFVMMVCKENNE